MVRYDHTTRDGHASPGCAIDCRATLGTRDRLQCTDKLVGPISSCFLLIEPLRGAWRCVGDLCTASGRHRGIERCIFRVGGTLLAILAAVAFLAHAFRAMKGCGRSRTSSLMPSTSSSSVGAVNAQLALGACRVPLVLDGSACPSDVSSPAKVPGTSSNACSPAGLT